MADGPHETDMKFTDLVDIMRALRTPVTGCPWDLEQDFSSIAPYTIEEAYEVADAIQRNDMSDLRDELGDLLLQVVFHAQMASEQNAFNIDDVVVSISQKMTRRHPHVFGDNRTTQSASEQTRGWEDIKAAERAQKSQSGSAGMQARSGLAGSALASSALEGVALALPALMRAEKLQKRAARTGFDWTDVADIFDKLDEEKAEVAEAIEQGAPDRIEDEIGDMLFVCANLARRMKIDPEAALKRANQKFERRFRAMEALSAASDTEFATLPLAAQEQLWQLVKAREKDKD